MYENPLKSLHRKGHEIELITKKTNYKVLLKEQKTVFGGWTNFLKNQKFSRIIPFSGAETWKSTDILAHPAIGFQPGQCAHQFRNQMLRHYDCYSYCCKYLVSKKNMLNLLDFDPIKGARIFRHLCGFWWGMFVGLMTNVTSPLVLMVFGMIGLVIYLKPIYFGPVIYFDARWRSYLQFHTDFGL